MFKLIRNVVIVLGGAAALVFCVMLLLSEWLWGGFIKPQLDAQYVPTAQALFAHPLPTPDFIHSIQPLPGSVIEGDERILVGTRLSYADAETVPRWSAFSVNMQQSGQMGISWLSGDQFNTTVNFSAALQLAEGYHLVELQLKPSLIGTFDSSTWRTYQWAYYVPGD